jgi:phenol 2-monooxygenase
MVDLLDPYILLVHQGMVEEIFLKDLEARGVEVARQSTFTGYKHESREGLVEVTSRTEPDAIEDRLTTKYLVGCDGAHSRVRKAIPEARAEGSSTEALWGVLDGVIDTDFPDLWSKVVVYSEEYGNVLCIPRERNMTRLYIELRSESDTVFDKSQATQEVVMERARNILKPYRLSWESVGTHAVRLLAFNHANVKIEWFGTYQIGQRVANKFTDETLRVFIAGDVRSGSLA